MLITKLEEERNELQEKIERAEKKEVEVLAQVTRPHAHIPYLVEDTTFLYDTTPPQEATPGDNESEI